MTPATLPDYRTDDPALKSLPRGELAALQDERLRTVVAYARRRGVRARRAGAGVLAARCGGIQAGSWVRFKPPSDQVGRQRR